jgi:primary-amine oxidase
MTPINVLTQTSLSNATVGHPLEPLTADEVRKAVEIVRKSGKACATTRFISIALNEPDKTSTQGASSRETIPREAFIVLYDRAKNACFEGIVSLKDERVLSCKHVPGAQPMMTVDEMIECERAVLDSPEFREALVRRTGIADTSLVMVDIWSAGYYGEAEERERRLVRPLCFLRADATDNGYARPIEGIRPVVDLASMKVVRIEEYERVPIPPGESNYAASRRTSFYQDIKPLEIVQPEGPSFQVSGNAVNWWKWSFVIGFNAREGLTLHDIRYRDGDRDRSILYRASLTEMVVPYGDPGPTQRRKNAFDVGEYGMGNCANSLKLGCDCLGYIHYFDAHLCDSKGEPIVIPNAICMHEEDFGILWKHTDRRLADSPEVRRSRRLVVSSISTVENYEYGFFWYFYQDGTIQFEVKLTGILSTAAYPAGKSPVHGELVAPQVYAPNHQHFFNMRLDFDLDGRANTVYRVDVTPDAIDENNPFENAFQARSTVLKTEKEARGRLNLESARTWKIVNPGVRNSVGRPVGYKLIPGDNSIPFGSPNAWWRKRAGFVEHHVWVTPYSADERYGAGDYPNQNAGGDGLIRWTERDRPIENVDVVVWYTMGHTHIPRPEDYPVMPTAYIGFSLKPFGFFDANPALDVPPSDRGEAKKSCSHC